MTIPTWVAVVLSALGALVSWFFSYRANQAARKANAIAMRPEYLALDQRFKDVRPKITARSNSTPISNDDIRTLDEIAAAAKLVDKTVHDAVNHVADVAQKLSAILKVKAVEPTQTNREFALELEHTAELSSAVAKVEAAFEDLLS